jgi:CelD/BcsL family acetyltransferase involved in cellulose biosynthesis
MSWELLPAASFGAYAGDWHALNADGPAAALLAPEFVQALLDEFADGGVLLAHYRLGGVVVVMTLLRARSWGRWETFQPSQAPVTLWLEQTGAVAPAMLPHLLDQLMRALPGQPLLLGLTQRDPSIYPRPAALSRTGVASYVETARISLIGTFDEFWDGRGKNLRSNLKKQRARLARDGTAVRLEMTRSAHGMAAAVADFGRLESAGWKSSRGTAIHPDNSQGRFYRNMLEAMARREAACVYRYWFGERLVAIKLCVEDRHNLVILKTTYDEALTGQYSPALLMLEEICQQLYAGQRLHGIEFYGKVMDWHRRWSDEVRMLYHVNHYRWGGLRRLHQFSRRHAIQMQPEPSAVATME